MPASPFGARIDDFSEASQTASVQLHIERYASASRRGHDGQVSPTRPSIWTREQTTHILEWDKKREYRRVYNANRTAKRASMPATLQLDEWKRELGFWEFSCAYCLRSGFDCLEHVVPVSKGGATDAANVVPACRGCNRSKVGHDREYQLLLAKNLIERGKGILTRSRRIVRRKAGTALSVAARKHRAISAATPGIATPLPASCPVPERSRMKMSGVSAPTKKWQPVGRAVTDLNGSQATASAHATSCG